MANEYQEEKKEKGYGVLVLGFLVFSIFMLKQIENYFGEVNSSIVITPFVIAVIAYGLRKRRKAFTVFAILSLMIYSSLIYDLSDPFIKDWAYALFKNKDEKSKVTMKDIDVFHSGQLGYDCSSMDLSSEETCDCISYLEGILFENDKKNKKIEFVEKKFKRLESDKELFLNSCLSTGKALLSLDYEKAEVYFNKGLSYANEVGNVKYAEVFKYYLATIAYLDGSYEMAKEILKENIQSTKKRKNIKMKLISELALLNIRKNLHELNLQEDYNLMKKLVKESKGINQKELTVLLNILQGDLLMKNLFFNLGNIKYAEVMDIILLIPENNRISGILAKFYEKLGHSYKYKGKLDRAYYYLNMSSEKGVRNIGIGECFVDYYLADIVINKNDFNYKYKNIETLEQQRNLVEPLLSSHYFREERDSMNCEYGKVEIKNKQKNISSKFTTSIKRGIYYNRGNNKEVLGSVEATEYFEKALSYSSSLIEKTKSHYDLAHHYYKSSLRFSKMLSHINKVLEHYKLSCEIVVLNNERFSKNCKNPLDKIKIHTIKTRNINSIRHLEAFHLKSLIYVKRLDLRGDKEDLQLAYNASFNSISTLMLLWRCTKCNIDKKQLINYYYEILDFWIYLAMCTMNLPNHEETIPYVINIVEFIKSGVSLGVEDNFSKYLIEKGGIIAKRDSIDKVLMSLKKRELNEELEFKRHHLLNEKERLDDPISKYDQNVYLQSTLFNNGLQVDYASEMGRSLKKDELFINYYHCAYSNTIYAFYMLNDRILTKIVEQEYVLKDLSIVKGDRKMKGLSFMYMMKKVHLDYGLFEGKEFWESNASTGGFLNLLYNLYLTYPEYELDAKNYEKVYISPHGSLLNNVPFEILLGNDESINSNQYEDLPYLIKSSEVSYIPSVLYFLKTNNKQNKLKPISFALNIAPNTEDELFSTDTIIEYFKNKKSVLLLGKEANKRKVKEELPKYNIIHFSTHGKFDIGNPMYSTLEVFPKENMDSSLYMHELFDMKLNAKLVVLGACETVVGDDIGQVGILNSFAHAFHYAGCPTVVGTQWKVNDTSTGEILVYFYEFLEEGKTVSDALRSAKLKYLAQDRRDTEYHPYYWGGLVVSGNPDTKINFD